MMRGRRGRARPCRTWRSCTGMAWRTCSTTWTRWSSSASTRRWTAKATSSGALLGAAPSSWATSSAVFRCRLGLMSRRKASRCPSGGIPSWQRGGTSKSKRPAWRIWSASTLSGRRTATVPRNPRSRRLRRRMRLRLRRRWLASWTPYGGSKASSCFFWTMSPLPQPTQSQLSTGSATPSMTAGLGQTSAIGFTRRTRCAPLTGRSCGTTFKNST
mmetsp:Transcript_49692/g.158694  ORF Transcript_49692/g.158694 Transcript_49692/m.158694 type:complete len:215 (-) Transcript_49692:1422-2066(-)